MKLCPFMQLNMLFQWTRDLWEWRNTHVKINNTEMNTSPRQEWNSQHSSKSYLLHISSHVAFRLFFKLRQPERQKNKSKYINFQGWKKKKKVFLVMLQITRKPKSGFLLNERLSLVLPKGLLRGKKTGLDERLVYMLFGCFSFWKRR